MNLGQWTSSPECRGGGHCGECRATGSAFRAALARSGWQLPPDAPDFACPHGRPWGFVPAGTPAPVPVPELDPDERALVDAAANPEGWGDHVAAAIHRIGADRAYKLVRTAVGLPVGCGGCNARRQALNRLEGWVKDVFRRD